MAFIYKQFKHKKRSDDTYESAYVAMYEFSATRPDELDFVEGDELEFLNETDGGFWKALNKRTQKVGFVPSNFIKKKDDDVGAQNADVKKDKLITYVALYDYDGTESGTLSFKKGDKMALLEATNADWWKLRLLKTSKRSNSSLLEGYVPSSYIKKVDEPQETWFFGKISRTEAMVMLQSNHNSPGSFLVRKSESATGYSLSVLQSNKEVKHYRITENNEGRYLVYDTITFEDLKELVEYYLRSDCPPGRLREPCRGSADPLQQQPSAQATSYGDRAKAWEIDRSTLKFGVKLGSGNFGEVMRARWNGQTDVAVKTIKSDASERQEFIREVEAMQCLRHPKLVKLYGICTSPDQPLLIVAELVADGALLNYLRKNKETRRHTKAELVAMGAQVASGMAYLESENFVHRDLAARNVLVANGGKTIKIADFGLARLLQDDVYSRSSDYKIPTKWTAPEAITQFRYTCKSDVWSFGILLYEVITHGNVPYPGMSNKDTLQLVREGHRMERDPECPPPLYRVMTRCWHERPEDRPSFAVLKPEMERLPRLLV